MAGFVAPGPFLRLYGSRPAAGLTRLLHETENNKALYTKFIKGSSRRVRKLRTRARLQLRF